MNEFVKGKGWGTDELMGYQDEERHRKKGFTHTKSGWNKGREGGHAYV